MSDQRIRILHVVNRFGVGGYERQQTELIKRLPQERYDQVVATMEKSGPFLDEVQQRGIEVIEFPFTSFFNAHAIRQYRALAELIRDRQIHLAHCYELYSAIFGTVSCRLAGLKKIVVGRGNIGDQHTFAQRLVQRLAYSLTTAIIPNAHAVEEVLITREFVPRRKLFCIHNGVDIDRFFPRERPSELAASLELSLAAPIVGIVGALRPIKDHETFVRAAAPLAPLRLRARSIRPPAPTITHPTFDITSPK